VRHQIADRAYGSDKLPAAIFTPSTKAEQGLHDENISYEEMCDRIGPELSKELSQRSIELYTRGADFARGRGSLSPIRSLNSGWSTMSSFSLTK